jgi:hypothetical protein
MNALFNMGKDGSSNVSSGNTPAHLRVITTSSAHVMVAGKLARGARCVHCIFRLK